MQKWLSWVLLFFWISVVAAILVKKPYRISDTIFNWTINKTNQLFDKDAVFKKIHGWMPMLRKILMEKI